MHACRQTCSEANLVVPQDGLENGEHPGCSNGAQSRAVRSGAFAHQHRQSKQRRPDDLL